MTTQKDIDGFLEMKRIAIIGVSRNPKDFTRSLYQEFVKRGYDAVPVNPAMPDVDGKTCYANIQDVQPCVDAALLLTPSGMSERIVRECDAANVRRIWLYRAGGNGAVSAEAVKLCESRGIPVVAGECPFMFFPQTPWMHRVHGFCKKIVGTYPR